MNIATLRVVLISAVVSIGSLLACNDKTVPATAIVVSVKSDLGEALATLEVEALASGTAKASSATRLNLADHELPTSIVVTKGSKPTIVVIVRGLDKAQRTLVSYRAEVTFRDRTTLRLPVYLGRICRNACTTTSSRTCTPKNDGAYEPGDCRPLPSFEAEDLQAVTRAGEEHDWAIPIPSTGAVSRDSGVENCLPEAPLVGVCNPIAQCGCADDLMCGVVVMSTTDGPFGMATCTSEGTLSVGGPCIEGEETCEAGTLCDGSICKALCNEDADCPGDDAGVNGNGTCRDVLLGEASVSGLRTCALPCDFESGMGCAQATVCGDLGNGAYECLAPQRVCPDAHLNDGVCDEPEGTRLCVDGTDPGDCP